MTKDMYGDGIVVGSTVVFTSTPHRGSRPKLRTGNVTKIHSSGRVSIQEHQRGDLLGDTSIYTGLRATGRIVTLNSTRNILAW